MSKFDLGAIVAAVVGFVVPILVWARDFLGRAGSAIWHSFRAVAAASAVWIAVGVVALGGFWGGHILGARRAKLDRPALGFVAPPSNAAEMLAATDARVSKAREEAALLRGQLEAAQAELARSKVSEERLEKALAEARRRPVVRPTVAPASATTGAPSWSPFER